jgi:hypothetical protein
MLADTAGSILTGISALGTLILAFVTFYLARSAVQGRLDGLAPRVVVTKLTVEDQALSYPTKLPGIPQPFTGEWNMTLQGDHRLGIRASGQVRNESEVTALMQFDLPAGHQATEVVEEADTGGGPGPLGLTCKAAGGSFRRRRGPSSSSLGGDQPRNGCKPPKELAGMRLLRRPPLMFG